ncbi:MAG: PAS domain S-box protein [Nitrospiraceae bacterium]
MRRTAASRPTKSAPFDQPNGTRRRATAPPTRTVIEHDSPESPLHISETHVRMFYEDNPSMYFVVDAHGRIRSSNRYGAETLGYRVAELTNRPVVELFDTHDREAASAALAAAFAHPQTPHHWEFRKRTRDGEILWVHETARVVQEPSGEWVALIVCHDITAQRRAASALREQEHAVRALHQATAAVGASLEQRIQTVLELGCRQFHLPIGTVTRVDGDMLEVLYAWPPESIPRGTRKMRGSFCGATMDADKPLGIQHVGASEWAEHPAYRELGFESYLGTKLVGSAKTHGTLCFLSPTPSSTPFTAAQVDFLTLMAQWVSHEMDRRDAESALRESRELFAVAFHASPNPMVITELTTGRCIETNEAGLREFGYTREEAIGQTTLALGIWSSPQDREDLLYSMATDGRVRNGEALLRTKSGKELLCRLSCERITHNGISCLLTVGQDIREQRATEAALRASEDRFRRLFEYAPVGLCILGSDRTVRKTNGAFRILIGYDDADILHATMDRYTHPDDIAETHALDRQLWSGAISQYHDERRLIRKNGGFLWVHVTVSPLVFTGGEERLSVAIVQDVTARKLAEQALAQRERDLRQAMDDREQVSQDLHDGILQSLYAVGLSLDTTGRLVGRAPHRAKRTLSGSISQLNRTIQEIRSFITTLSLDLLGAAHFTQALKAVVASFCTAGCARCDILISPAAGRRLARAHCVHLLNIVREAVSNSVRHGRASRVRIGLRTLKDGIQLSVTDNGSGFAPRKTTKHGYGLRNMRARADKLGGLLRIVSRPDRGTRIVVTFPTEDTREQR